MLTHATHHRCLVFKGSNFFHKFDEFCPYKWNLWTNWLGIGSYFNAFNTSGFIEFVLVLLPLCLFWTYFSREKLVLINLNFSRENLLQLQLLKFILKCGNYRCTGAMIRCISINFKIGQFFLSENKTPFSIKATAVRVKISDTKINFFGLQSPYHRLANRKKLILPIEKYFKTLKGTIMGTIGI